MHTAEGTLSFNSQYLKIYLFLRHSSRSFRYRRREIRRLGMPYDIKVWE